MTATLDHEFARPVAAFESWHQRWCQDGGRSVVLHRVVHGVWNDRDWRFNDADAACGKEGPFYIPGIFSRMGAPRCKRCCKAVGIPAGDGAPVNDKSLSEEERNR